MTGYVRAQRDRFDHPMFKADKFCRGYAWDWLIAMAAWKPMRAKVAGKIIPLRRGQLSYSVRFMAETWGWSKSSVDRFLNALEAEGMIGTDAGTGQLVITIRNYNKFQSSDDAGGTVNGTPPGTAAGQQRDSSGTNKKKDNQDKKEKKKEENTTARAVALPDPDHSAEFDRVWAAYPRKVGVAAARAAWLKARKAAAFEDIAAPLRAYIRAVKGTELQFIAHLATWLNKRRWLDDDQSHACNAARTSTADLEQLATISASEDIARLFPIEHRKALAS